MVRRSKKKDKTGWHLTYYTQFSHPREEERKRRKGGGISICKPKIQGSEIL